MTTPAATVTIGVRHESDVVVARRTCRELAALQGIAEVATEALAIAVSELARNVLVHAGEGTVTFAPIVDGARRGVRVTVQDEGPGIQSVERALEDGYSTSGSLGCGLAGAKRLAHEFELTSKLSGGTLVTLTQWDHKER